MVSGCRWIPSKISSCSRTCTAAARRLGKSGRMPRNRGRPARARRRSFSWRWKDRSANGYPNGVGDAHMLNVALGTNRGSPLQVLCLGAHSDDIEIGCGGTILKLLEARRDVRVCWVVFGASQELADEARTSVMRFLEGAVTKEVEVQSFRDGFFPYVGSEIKEYFEALKLRCAPDVTFTHFREDRHQDHRVISDLTWNTYRNHLILEYEIPKYDGDLGSPNCFVSLDDATSRRKAQQITECF